MIDGIIFDTYDPRRSTLIIENGIKRIAERCVYGYYYKEAENNEKYEQ